MGAGKMPFANYNELSDSTFKLTLFVCFADGRNKIKIFPSYSIRNWASLIFSGKNLVMVDTARGFWNSLPFPNVFATNVKFPRHTVLTISHIRPDDGLNPPPLTAPLHLYTYAFSKSHAVHIRGFGGIWRYRMQRFSWQTQTICATGASVECQSKKLLKGGGGGG